MSNVKPSRLATVAEAQDIILRTVPVLPPVEYPLSEALGMVLAEEVTADLDLPAFDCSAMDGYAVRAADLARVPVVLRILEQITAGMTPTRRVEPGTCSGITTGAMVPEGADAVVMVEQTERVGEDRVRFLSPVGKTNIRKQGEEVRAGGVVLSAGTVIRPAEVGLLASVGRVCVEVVRRPRVAVLATGDELVDPGQRPAPGQVRNSNGPTLLALCARGGFEAVSLGVARDRLDELEAGVRAGLEHDVLLVSAGVSVGAFDLVPRAFAAVGAKRRLHGIRVKPGKPVAFYTAGRRVIFGVPGKPVSTIVSFGLFVLPALRRMAGYTECLPELVPAVMRKEFRRKAGGPSTSLGAALSKSKGGQQYEPARLQRVDDHYEVEALPTHGSADLVALCRANALLVAPADQEQLQPGALVDVVRIV